MTLFRLLLRLLACLLPPVLGLIVVARVAGGLAQGEVLGLNVNATHSLEIYLLDTRLNFAHNLTHTSTNDLQFVWSPDGSQIAFISGRSGGRRLHVMDSSGQNIRSFPTVLYVSYPGWLPDGGHIVFQGSGPNDTPSDIYLVDTRTGELRNLTDSAAADRMPDVSPDGTRVVYIAEQDGKQNIYMLDWQQNSAHQLTDTPWQKALPRWSPDGTRIAFAAHVGGRHLLHTMNADGSDAFPVLSTPLQLPPYFVWSPDSTMIATTVRNRAIAIVDLAQRRVHSISGSYDQIRMGSWSADSQRLSYTARRGGENHVVIADRQGEVLYRWVSRVLNAISLPAWKP